MNLIESDRKEKLDAAAIESDRGNRTARHEVLKRNEASVFGHFVAANRVCLWPFCGELSHVRLQPAVNPLLGSLSGCYKNHSKSERAADPANSIHKVLQQLQRCCLVVVAVVLVVKGTWL